jgi:hypothetical protein
MDSLVTAAARALAAGDLLGALKRVTLRDDAPALALRGIAMAQLGNRHTPTTLRLAECFSVIAIVALVRSAREMLKPNNARRPSLIRYLPECGLFVNRGGRTIVQSNPLAVMISSIPAESITAAGKNSVPTIYAGGYALKATWVQEITLNDRRRRGL